MVTGIHFLLSYACTYECDHCFLYCSPSSPGTFTLPDLRRAFDQIDEAGHIESVYFEGGEPFLYYALMLEGIRMARERKLSVGIVTNAYWANSVEDAELWLKPLAEMGIDDLSISDDLFHHADTEKYPAKFAYEAAKKLGLPTGSICIDQPIVINDVNDPAQRGQPIVGGDVRFRGRAADKLIDGLPRRAWSEFRSCTGESLDDPGRIHLDPFGNVHVCQGLLMGNIWKTPMKQLFRDYDPESHPIIGPLLEGGPALLAQEYGVSHQNAYVDQCHMCYDVRKLLLNEFPEDLGPKQVYGLPTDS